MKTTRSKKKNSKAASRRRPLVSDHNGSPGWLSPRTAADLLHSDKEVREAAKRQAFLEACNIVRDSLFKRMVQLVSPTFPRGVYFPGWRFDLDGTFCENSPYLTMNRRALERLGEALAEKSVASEESDAIVGWAIDVAKLYRGFRARGGEIELMLLSALQELNDASIAENCARVWLNLVDGNKLPPSWRAVHELFCAHPELLEFRLEEMLNRGFIPPPWVTVAMAAG